MKKAGAFVASVAAASSFALPPVAADRYVGYPCSASHKGYTTEAGKEPASGSRKGEENEKFTPRFDGLRFIETLVTAHR